MLDGLAHCMPETHTDAMLGCATCPYNDFCHRGTGTVSLPVEMVEDMRRLAKQVLGNTITM